MRIAVVGSRNFDERELILSVLRTLKEFHEVDEIVTGGAPGADSLAVEASKTLAIKQLIFPADWQRYGKKAGPIRNTEVVAQSDAALIFVNKPLKESKGSLDTFEKFIQSNKSVIVFELTSGRVRMAYFNSGTSNKADLQLIFHKLREHFEGSLPEMGPNDERITNFVFRHAS